MGSQGNGGPTETIALQGGSPARNAIPMNTNGCGDVVNVDQRGVTRPQESGCDIGAYEYQVTTALHVTGLTGSVNGKGYAVVKWRTTSEARIAGFYVWRKIAGGKWRMANGELIQAKYPGSAVGARYRAVDKRVRGGRGIVTRLRWCIWMGAGSLPRWLK